MWNLIKCIEAESRMVIARGWWEEESCWVLYILLILECDNTQSENKGCYRNTKKPDRAGEKPGSLWSLSAGQIPLWLLIVPEGASY